MKRISLVLALHNHQPVGNFDHVIDEACQRSYFPFLDVLEAHPKINIALHVTGCLAEWILQRYPEYFARLRKLVEAGRIEMMTGGFHEPILSVIPLEDRIGQIRKLSRFVEEQTGCAPQGMWIAERVWEPQLPSTMRAAGVRYTVLDDSHFFASGLTENDIFGYYMTEDAGQAVAVFPGAKKLRYTIPFGEVEETIEYLDAHASEGNARLAVFADDGEKFGVWPKTYQHVYEEKWLDKFFGALEQNAEWIQTTTFSQALRDLRPLGRIYLPTASYTEMMTWALPAASVAQFETLHESLEEREDFDEIAPFVRGGFWRNFLVKYEESNHMHKRMLRLSASVQQSFSAAKTADETRRAETARDLLWQSQCNCAYWHGVFGGLYLPHLRSAIYERIVGAEAQLRAAKPRIEVVDFDADGADEVFIETPSLNLCLKPSKGGALVEVDDLRTRTNVSDTLTRRAEAYHEKVAQAVLWHPEDGKKEKKKKAGTESIHDVVRTKEAGLERHLIYDWHRRSCSLAHFMAGWTTLEDFISGRYTEDGDFVNQPFVLESAKILENGWPEAVLSRKGGLYQGGGVRWLTLRRTVRAHPQEPRFIIRHDIKNTSEQSTQAKFGIEFIANFLAPKADDRRVFVSGRELKDSFLSSAGEEKWVDQFGMVDEWRGLRMTITLDQPAVLWRLPIETVSLSEAGFERVYQGTCFLPYWEMHLNPGEQVSYEMEVRFSAP